MTAVVYPSVIARACAVLDESPAFRDLPDGYLRVVSRIIKKINIARPQSPIFASRGTIAAESGKSIETVGRVVKWLEDKGLIQRTQKARAGLRGSSSPLVPTPALLAALLLDGANKEKMRTEEKRRLPVSQDASKSENPENNNLSENSPEGRAFVRIQGKTVPSDLAWLVQQNGLSVTGLLGLMRHAGKTGQRLSDVVAATRTYLHKLRDRRLYAYLITLLSKDKDYAAIHIRSTETAIKEREQERLRYKSEELAGRRFQSRDGKFLAIVENNGIITEIRNGARACRKLTTEFLEAIGDGRLVAV